MPPDQPSNARFIVLFGVAAALLLVGAAVLQSRVLLPSPEFRNFQSQEAYQAAYAAWTRTIRLQGFIGTVFLDVGVFLFVFSGLLVAFQRTDLPDGLRRAFIVAPLALAAIWLVILLVGSLTVPG